MSRDGSRRHAVEPARQAKQGIGEEGNEEAERGAGRRRQADLPCQAVRRYGGAALEADGEHEEERKPLGEGFGHRQVRARQRGEEAEREEEDDGREQVRLRQSESIGHWLNPRGVGAADNPVLSMTEIDYLTICHCNL